MTFRYCLLLVMSLLGIGFVVAQETCPDIIQDALSTLHTNCLLTERNQACYGNISLKVVPQSGVTQFKFDTIGDIANVTDIRTLDLAPLDAAASEWGLVMMRLQANIPDTLPGQNVTFLLFGDVTIENAAQTGQNPMQAFYLTTGTGDARCLESPESGLMVQTPSGIKEVSFNINGVDVEMGSTVIFQAERGKKMRITTIEGKARIKVGKKTIPVVQGSQYTAPINENLEITQPEQGEVKPYQQEEVQALPVAVLDRPITIHQPLTQTQVDEVQILEDTQQPLCSDEVGSYLPPCTRPLIDSHGNEVEPSANGDVPLLDETGDPLFRDQAGEEITTIDDYYRYLSYWTESPTLTDDSGNTINVTEDGTVSVVDLEGNTFTSEPDGTYVYTEADGTTYTTEEPSLEGAFTLDETGDPVVISESGAVFPDEDIQQATEAAPVEAANPNGTGDPVATNEAAPPVEEPSPTDAPPVEETPPTDESQQSALPGESAPADENPTESAPPPEGTGSPEG